MIEEGEIYPVPTHIKTHAKNYLYPHDFGGWVKQTYTEKERLFYENKGIGFEKNLAEWREKIRGED